MSDISEISLSFLASNPTTSMMAKVIFRVLLIASLACLIHFVSPMWLTRVLVAAIDNVANTYLEAIEAGVLFNSDVHTVAKLSNLQIKVSLIREASLRSSLSTRHAFREFFKGRTFASLQNESKGTDREMPNSSYGSTPHLSMQSSTSHLLLSLFALNITLVATITVGVTQ
ncbi:hypothetical protein C8R44DRAFT_879294 [Mycena epipterygia]|nr:hypothetical protein C8R44DRAFT_879294 [Mycena epipterygia]